VGLGLGPAQGEHRPKWWRVHWTHAVTGEHQMGRLRPCEDAMSAADQLRRHPTAGGLVTNVIVRPAERRAVPAGDHGHPSTGRTRKLASPQRTDLWYHLCMAPKVTQIRVRVDDDLLARIERARGLVPREPWMRRALDKAAREQLEAALAAGDAKASGRVGSDD
jgi:Arc/MetJ family transcription regulator